MKMGSLTGVFVILGIVFIAAGPAAGQVSRCVILEKEGNRALVSCDGQPTRYIDLRGRTDIYKVGDSIDVPETIVPGSNDRGMKKK